MKDLNVKQTITLSRLLRWLSGNLLTPGARVRGAMAPVVSYGILIKRLIYYPWGIRFCDYDEKKNLNLFYNVVCMVCIPRKKGIDLQG